MSTDLKYPVTWVPTVTGTYTYVSASIKATITLSQKFQE